MAAAVNKKSQVLMAFPLVNIRGHSNKSKLFFFLFAGQVFFLFPLGGHLVCVQCLEAIRTYVLYTVYILSTTSGRDRCSNIAIHSRFSRSLSGFRRLPFLTSRQRRTRGNYYTRRPPSDTQFSHRTGGQQLHFGGFSPVFFFFYKIESSAGNSNGKLASAHFRFLRSEGGKR